MFLSSEWEPQHLGGDGLGATALGGDAVGVTPEVLVLCLRARVRGGVAFAAAELEVAEVVAAAFVDRDHVMHFEVVVVGTDDACAVACPDLGADRCPFPAVADASFGAFAGGAAAAACQLAAVEAGAG